MEPDDYVTWVWSAGAGALLAALVWVTSSEVAVADRALLVGSLFAVWTLALGLSAHVADVLPEGAWDRDGPGALDWQDVGLLLLPVAVYPIETVAEGPAVALALFVLGLTLAAFAVGASFVLDAVGRPPVSRRGTDGEPRAATDDPGAASGVE